MLIRFDVGDVIVIDRHAEDDEYIMFPNKMGSEKPEWFPPIGTITEVVKTLECNYLLVKFPVQEDRVWKPQATEEIVTTEAMCREGLFRMATKGEKFLYTINNRKIVIPKLEEDNESLEL